MFSKAVAAAVTIILLAPLEVRSMDAKADKATSTTATATTTTSMGDDVLSLCSCSPTQYQFQIDLDRTCDDDDYFSGNNNGIGMGGETICMVDNKGSSSSSSSSPSGDDGITGIGVGVGGGGSSGNDNRGGRKLLQRLYRDSSSNRNHWRSSTIMEGIDISSHVEHAKRRRLTTIDDAEMNNNSNNNNNKILTSILFLELSTSTNVTILNQDSTYFDTTLPNGSIVNYTSISANLNTSLSLEEQMEYYVPGGVMMVLFGTSSSGSGGDGGGGEEDDAVVWQNTVAWGYDLEQCGVEPVGVGDSIGWVVLDNYVPAIPEFCPAPHKIFSKSSKIGKSETGAGFGGKAGKVFKAGTKSSSSTSYSSMSMDEQLGGSSSGKSGKFMKGKR